MKTKIFRLLISIKDMFLQTSDEYYLNKELRRKRVKEISSELLSHPLEERLDMVKKIEHIVLIESKKQELQFEEMYSYWKDKLSNYK